MGQIETVINYSKEIEAILETKYSATGKGLQEKMMSVESSIPKEVASKIRKIAFIRNSAVHQLGYQVENLAAFSEMCDFVIEKLGGRLSTSSDSLGKVQFFGIITGLVAGIIGLAWGWYKVGIWEGIAIGVFLLFVAVALTSAQAIKFYLNAISMLVGLIILITIIYGAVSFYKVLNPVSVNQTKKTSTSLSN